MNYELDSCICPRQSGREHHHTFACFLFAIAKNALWKVRHFNNYNAR
jgi:hypothetical protein